MNKARAKPIRWIKNLYIQARNSEKSDIRPKIYNLSYRFF